MTEEWVAGILPGPAVARLRKAAGTGESGSEERMFAVDDAIDWCQLRWPELFKDEMSGMARIFRKETKS